MNTKRQKVKYWIDSEFVETPGHIELISIGIVCEDGRTYYAVNTEANLENASAWVKNNVLKNMPEYCPAYNDLRKYSFSEKERGKAQGKKTIENIKTEIYNWCGQNNNVPEDCEFWGYYSDYDWVLFCWLFGTMMDLPKGFPKFCLDVKQLMEQYKHFDKTWKEHNHPDPKEAHNALVDAIWTKELYEKVKEGIRLFKLTPKELN